VVFTSGCKLTLMPLDVTHKAITTPERLARIGAIESPVSRACHGMLSFYGRHDVEKYGTVGGPLHDPCVIAYLIDAGLFGGKQVPVEIEIGSNATLGMTVVDWWEATGRAPNCMVMNTIDHDGFYGLLTDRLARL
jgi:purine nucleosidase